MLDYLSKYYQENGYITTKAYLKPQNIKDGQLDIKILEGKIEDIIHKETKKSSPRIKTAFIFLKDEALNLRDLETSLESINRVPSSDASFKIYPGKKQGNSLVEIETKKTFPVHLQIGLSGEKTLEDNNPNVTAVLSLDNLFRINDIFTYRLNGTKIQKEYQSTKGSEYNYSFPLGSYIYELSKSFTSYRQGVEGLNDTYLSNGDTNATKLKVSKVLNRNKNNKFEAVAAINHKSNKNYFQNQLIEVSSYKTTQVLLKLNHTYIKNWGQLYSSYTYHQGTDWFDARADNYNNDEVDSSRKDSLEFVKHTFDSSLTYYLKNRSYFFNSNFHIQHSDDYLYNIDKLTIGSAYTVRGYSKSNYYGNKGLYLKNDFTKQFTLNLNKYLLETISLFIGLDYGKSNCQSDNENACGDLAGTALGFKTNAKNLSSDFTWSKALKKIDKNEEIKNIFLYNLTLKF